MEFIEFIMYFFEYDIVMELIKDIDFINFICDFSLGNFYVFKQVIYCFFLYNILYLQNSIISMC